MNASHDLPRRTFLGHATRVALACSTAPFLPLHRACIGAAAETSASTAAQAKCPPLAVFSKVYQELKLDFEQAAEVTAEAGLQGVDCPVRPGGEITPERAADDMPRYAEALRRRGCSLLLLSTAIQSPSTPHTESLLRTARQLGVHHYRLGPWLHETDRPRARQLADIKAHLNEVAELSKSLGLCALFQNHSPAGNRTYVGGDLDELRMLVSDYPTEHLAVAFDLGHAIVVHGDQWAPKFEQLREKARIFYVKDAKRGARFVRFGEGEFASTGFFAQLRRARYNSPLSIHIEFDWAGKGNAKTRPALVKALKECRLAIERWWDA